MDGAGERPPVIAKGNSYSPNSKRQSSELNLGCGTISGSQMKASIPQELMELIPVYQKGSFPLPLAEGRMATWWYLLAYQSLCWPPGSLSISTKKHLLHIAKSTLAS